jgi:hypothetical protein
MAAGVRKIPPPIAVPATRRIRSPAPRRRASLDDADSDADFVSDTEDISRIISRRPVYSPGKYPLSAGSAAWRAS